VNFLVLFRVCGQDRAAETSDRRDLPENHGGGRLAGSAAAAAEKRQRGDDAVVRTIVVARRRQRPERVQTPELETAEHTTAASSARVPFSRSVV